MSNQNAPETQVKINLTISGSGEFGFVVQPGSPPDLVGDTPAPVRYTRIVEQTSSRIAPGLSSRVQIA